MFDPVAPAAMFVYLGFAFASRRNSATIAFSVGIVFQILYTVWIGGDFMRGRFFTPLLMAGVVAGSLSLPVRDTGGARRIGGLEGGLCGLLLLLGVIHAGVTAVLREGAPAEHWGIADEARYYPGYRLRAYLKQGRVSNPYVDVEFADALRDYVKACGPVTIHLRNPGLLGYYAGPDVTIIDMLGLTDRTIARLPKSHLVDPHPRPGHPDKFVPVSYLASCGDISIIPGWELGVIRQDCSLGRKAARFSEGDWLWDPAWDLPPRMNRTPTPVGEPA